MAINTGTLAPLYQGVTVPQSGTMDDEVRYPLGERYAAQKAAVEKALSSYNIDWPAALAPILPKTVSLKPDPLTPHQIGCAHTWDYTRNWCENCFLTGEQTAAFGIKLEPDEQPESDGDVTVVGTTPEPISISSVAHYLEYAIRQVWGRESLVRSWQEVNLRKPLR